jgi:hypothetical protein
VPLRRSQQSVAPAGARRFLYLDSKLTDELISGAEHGLYDVEQESRDRESDREAGVKVGVPFGAEIGLQASASAKVGVHVQRDLEQTPESRFARLVAVLAEHGSLKRLELVESAAPEKLRAGDLVELTGTLSVDNLNGLNTAVIRAQAVTRGLGGSPSLKEKSLGSTFARVYNIARQIWLVSVDPQLTAVLPAQPEFRFRGKLDAREIRDELGEPGHEIDATLLGKLDQVRKDGARITLVAVYR